MKRGSRISLLLATVLLIGLAGCSVLPRMDVVINHQGPLQYTATLSDEGGVSFESTGIPFTFQAKPGSMGGVLTHYEYGYYYADGSPVFAADNVVRSGHGLAIPAGLSCPGQDEESASGGCTINTPGVTFSFGEPVPLENVVSVDGQVSAQLWCDERPDINAGVKMTFYFAATNGAKSQQDYYVPIGAEGDFLPPDYPRPPVCDLI